MIDLNEMSLINIAEVILEEKQEPIDLYQLIDMVLEKSPKNIAFSQEVLTTFYADLTSSAKFVYTGQNTWDLKKNQKIELWEKDGSYFNEYTEVDDPELDALIAAEEEKERRHQNMLEQRREAQLAAEQEIIDEALEPSVVEISEPEVEAEEIVTVTEEVPVESKKEVVSDEDKAEDVEAEEGVEEEEYSEFDEDEYNEYMDTYEDEYDK